MKVGEAIAHVMKAEGIEILCGYPVNHLIEFAAAQDIRPVMVRQERIGVHMADAISRVTSGQSIGAFCMQHGPGAENAMGGVAQCYGESVPVLLTVGTVAAAWVVGLVRLAWTPSGFALGVALVLGALFALGKQAFPSYHLVTVGAICLAIAVARPRRAHRR